MKMWKAPVVLILGLFAYISGASIPHAQQPRGQLCCDDWWDPESADRGAWRPRHMGPGQRQRMFRHWTFMNEGVPEEYWRARNPFALEPEIVAAGRELYTQNCASCHGATGDGDGEAGRGLSPSPALLSYMVRMPMAVDEYLLWAISEGGVPFDTDMPAFKDTLSREEIWKIIAYMRAGFPQR